METEKLLRLTVHIKQAPINKRPFKQLIFALWKNIDLTMTQRVLNSLDWRKEIVNAMGRVVHFIEEASGRAVQ